MADKQHILLVDDDPNISHLVRLYLEKEGFGVTECDRGDTAIGVFRSCNPALVLLDVMLPGEDGVSLLRYLRQLPRTREIPVIMATAKGMEYDKIQSLDMGADDYLVKPFGMMEMVSRVKAVLRRCAPVKQSRQLSSGGVTLDLDGHTVTAAGQRVTLTFKEFALLQLFLAHPGMAFTRDQLFNDVWGADYVGETRTVDMHIRTLRQKLGECGDRIETVRGVGYRWEARP